MLRIILIICFFLATKLIAAQEGNKHDAEIHFDNSKVNYLKFTVTSPDDFETINWNDLKEIVQNNKEEDVVELEFEINLPKGKNIKKGNLSFKVKDTTKNMEKIIQKSKKGIKRISRITNNIKKQINEN
ncbi:hypothetical protein [Tenacibaculum xiamenense]|uniref:hypothetical protein n=1 Tax=Tenacibaculum xiamenense TaxID=1261553 RepID=UPI0038953351